MIRRFAWLATIVCLELTTCVWAQPKPPLPLPPRPGSSPKPTAPQESLTKLIQDLNSARESDRLAAAEKFRDAAGLAAKLATPALIKALDDKSEHVRSAALYALAGLGPDGQAALPKVRQLAKSANAEFERVLAAWTATQLTRDRTQLAELLPGLAKSLASKNEAVANQAAQTLAQFGLPAEPALRPALTDANPGTRVLALDTLGHIGARGAVPLISDRLTDSDEAVRAAAARALGEIGPGSKSAVPALEQALSGNNGSRTRSASAEALGRIGLASPAVVQSLVRAATDPDENVARGAIGALVRLRADTGVLNTLVPKLLADERPAVVAEAMLALSEQGASAAPVLRESLQNPATRPWALLVVADLGPAAKELVPQLIDMLSEAKPATRREILMALAKIGPDAAVAVPRVGPELAHSDKSVRYAAVFALGSIAAKNEAAEKTLTQNLAADDPFLKMTSAWALAKMSPGNPLVGLRAMPLLLAGLDSNDPALRQAAAQCLADLRPAPEKFPFLIPKLMESLASDDPRLKQSALDAVESVLAKVDAGRLLTPALANERTRPLAAAVATRLGPQAKSSAPALSSALADPRPEVRRDVALALAAIGPDALDAAPTLVNLLSDEDAGVRRAAAIALGEIGPDAKATTAALRELLAGQDNSVRPQAAWALALIAPTDSTTPPLVLPLLAAGLKSTSAEERAQSARALAGLKGAAKPALPALEYALDDPDPTVRATAESAIQAIGK